MIGRYGYLSCYPQVFHKLTEITGDDFAEIAATLIPQARAQRRELLTRPPAEEGDWGRAAVLYGGTGLPVNDDRLVTDLSDQ